MGSSSILSSADVFAGLMVASVARHPKGCILPGSTPEPVLILDILKERNTVGGWINDADKGCWGATHE